MGKGRRSAAKIVSVGALILGTGGLAIGLAGAITGGAAVGVGLLSANIFGLTAGTWLGLSSLALGIGFAPKKPEFEAARELADQLSLPALPAPAERVEWP